MPSFVCRYVAVVSLLIQDAGVTPGLTTGIPGISSGFVNYLRKLLLMLMAALWLPTATHCAMEAAGLVSEETEAHAGCCGSSSGACETESCNLLESGHVQPESCEAVLPVPDLCVILDLMVIVRGGMMPDATEVAMATAWERPDDFSPIWQFRERAAALPRAPSLILV